MYLALGGMTEAGSRTQQSLCPLLVHSARALTLAIYPALIPCPVRTVTPTRTLGAGIPCSIGHVSYR